MLSMTHSTSRLHLLFHHINFYLRFYYIYLLASLCFSRISHLEWDCRCVAKSFFESKQNCKETVQGWKYKIIFISGLCCCGSHQPNLIWIGEFAHNKSVYIWIRCVWFMGRNKNNISVRYTRFTLVFHFTFIMEGSVEWLFLSINGVRYLSGVTFNPMNGNWKQFVSINDSNENNFPRFYEPSSLNIE